MSMLPPSLRACLLLLVALAILPMAAMTVWSVGSEREHAVSAARDNLQRLVNLAANEAQSLIRARQILRDISSVSDVMGSTAACGRVMADILAKSPGFVNFGVIQLDGRVSCSAVGGSADVNLSDRLHFKRAVAEQRFIAGNYIFGRVVQKHTVNLTLPILSGNKVVSVVFAAVDLEMLDRFASEIRLPPDSVVWTVDETGTTIAREPAASGWLGERIEPELQQLFRAGMPAAGRLRNRDGVERVYAFAPVGQADLSRYKVAIGVPYSQIVGPAKQAQRLALLSLVAAVGLALLAAWFGGEWLMVRTIRHLGGTAHAIASGNLGVRTGIQTRQDEIGELGRALDAMAGMLQEREIERNTIIHRLREAGQRRDAFLAVLAHELRGPLAPISASAQLLKRAHEDNPEVSRSADVIERQTRQMARLLERLLDVSRLSRGLLALDLRPLPLRRVVEDALAQTAPMIDRKRQQLALDLGVEQLDVRGDHKRLVQALAEVFDNAAKYTPEGGHITVSLTAVQGKAMLSVADDGRGMAPELLAQVFEPFVQGAQAADATQAGLGLGLSLAHLLVELHGGSVSLASEGAGRGTTVTIDIPTSAPPP